MKIAYIILCHKNPQQVQGLIQQLDNGKNDFYLHIDKKANKNDFLFSQENIFYVAEEDREDIKWASIQMVSATIKLMSLVKKQNREYDYVILLSGQDFPIKTNAEIENCLKENKGFNFIEVLSHKDKNYKRYLKRNTIVYYNWMYKYSFIARMLKKLYILLTGGYNHTFPVFRRKNKFNFDFEFGSQWWAFTYDCFAWILNYIEDHPEIYHYYEKAITADESFFQTIYMLSPYKDKRKDKLTYLEMGRNHPKTFIETDFELLSARKSELFARKFDIDVDSEIIEKIKEKITS